MGDLGLDWDELEGDRGLGKVLSVRAIEELGRTVVAVGSVGRQYGWDEYERVWRSTTGTEWESIQSLASGDVVDSGSAWSTQLVVAQDRFVLVRAYQGGGGNVFTSKDGANWRAANTDFGDSQLVGVGVTDGTIVTATYDGGLWTSADGIDWSWTAPSSDTPAAVAAFVSAGSELIAFDFGSPEVDTTGPTTAWSTTDGRSWRRIGTLPGSGGPGYFSAAAIGDTVVAVSAPNDWSNARLAWIRQGVEWVPLANAPEGVFWLFPTSFGLVGIGNCLDDTWNPDFSDPDESNGVTWLSRDGSNWSLVEQPEPFGKHIEAVFEDGSRLIGLGMDSIRYYDRKPAGAVWVSPLPADPSIWLDASLEYHANVCADI